MKYRYINVGKANARAAHIAAKLGIAEPEKRLGAKAANQLVNDLEARAVAAGVALDADPNALAVTSFTHKPPNVTNFSAIPAQPSQLFAQTQITELSAKVAELTAKIDASKPPKDVLKLTAAFLAVEGQSGAQRVSGLPVDQFVLSMEKTLFFSNLKVSGHSLEHMAERYGPAKPAVGLQRTLTAIAQEKIDAAISKLK
jgi:hypothetical protein